MHCPPSPHYWTPRPGCPRLFLAPMEGLNDRSWRSCYAKTIGGFDEACTEFIRMPTGGHAPSLARAFNPHDTAPIPQAAQVMADDPDACAQICRELEGRGAPRIDLNAGCPSSTVVGKGAGASLLKDPKRLFEMVRAMKSAVSIPVSVKMRSGYSDESLFAENLAAVESAGCSFITLHARTRAQGYSGQARWELVAKAKQLTRLPIVGSGDVIDVASAQQLHRISGCDGIMVGRGAFRDPWIFWKLQSSFSHTTYDLSNAKQLQQLELLLNSFLEQISSLTTGGQAGRIKQIVRFLAQNQPSLAQQLALFLHPTYPARLLVEQLLTLWSRSCH